MVKKKIKAVGLISGGLDSSLAAKIIKDLEIDVYGVHYMLPWGCGDNPRAAQIAGQLNIPLKIIHLDDNFINIIKNPKHGYGSAINPCVDCRIYNLIKARQYMKEIGAEFVFTGEILGQRPMSQMRESLKKVEKGSGLEGRLLRPLCAKLLDPTIPEKENMVDRERLHAFSGRSRSDLQALGVTFNITNYTPTGGGCLLTDKNFARRINDIFKYGYKNLDEIIALRWGRHFRISEKFKIILGRDDHENTKILEHANPEDYIFETKDAPGPILILKGKNPDGKLLSTAASFVKRYSKFRNSNITVSCWPVSDKPSIQDFCPDSIDEIFLEQTKI